MKILVAFERSGIMRDALIALGHQAVSCDLYPSRRLGPHMQCDARAAVGYPWDAMIAHPVCRYLTNAGVKHLYRGGHRDNGPDPERWQAMREAAAMFRFFDSGPDVQHIPLRAIENPIPHQYARELMGRGADQYVHPYHFGSPFQKSTGWWLTGLALLVREREKDSYAPGEVKQAVWLMGPSADREEKRSQTDPEMARACAQQWFGRA